MRQLLIGLASVSLLFLGTAYLISIQTNKDLSQEIITIKEYQDCVKHYDSLINIKSNDVVALFTFNQYKKEIPECQEFQAHQQAYYMASMEEEEVDINLDNVARKCIVKLAPHAQMNQYIKHHVFFQLKHCLYHKI